MEKDILTLLILVVVVFLYITEKIPLVMTAFLSVFAVYFTGILPFSEAFSGFSNNATLMMIGMGVFAKAFCTTGLVDLLAARLQQLFYRDERFNEKMFIIIGGLLCALMSTMLNPMLTTAIFMSIIDGLAAKPDSKITRKNTIFPMSIAAAYGSMLTSISATTIIATSGLLTEHGYRPLAFLEPAVLGLPALLVYVLFFATIGHRLEEKWFDFDDSRIEEEQYHTDAAKIAPGKIRITLATLAVCILLFIFSSYKMGVVALAGATVLILTKCVELPGAFKGLNWSTIFLVAASMGFAKAVEASGAGKLIADLLVRASGGLIARPVGLCLLAMACSSLLSNLMSNSSSALLLVPIFIILAQETGAPIIPTVIAAGVGSGMVTATPVCTAHITQTTSVGYRFKDYLRIGGILNVLSILAGILGICIVYLI